MAQVYHNTLAGIIPAIDNAVTTITHATFAALPTVTAPNYLQLVLDAAGADNGPELVYVTHAAASNDVVVTGGRGRLSTRGFVAATSHVINTIWTLPATSNDMEELPFFKTAAKGDIVAGTAAKTVGTLTAGANDTVLIAASGETTGLKWGAVDTAQIATGAVETAKIEDLNVTTGKIADLGVTTGKIANDAITGAKIADDAVDTEHLAALAVTTAEIEDGAVTSDKIAALAVIRAKIELAEQIPVGVVHDYVGATAPTGWLLCYGQAVSRATYSDLFTLVSTAFGVGDGATTFNLPDFRGRIGVGTDNMGGVDATRLTSANTMGTAGGAETVTLTSGEVPAHTHTATTSSNGDHAHTYVRQADPGAGASGTGGFGYIDSGNSTTGTTGAHTHTLTTTSSGSGGAHSNMQPFITINKIIKF